MTLLPCCALGRVDPWECYQDTWQTTCSVLEHHRDLMKVRQPLCHGCTRARAGGETGVGVLFHQLMAINNQNTSETDRLAGTQ